MATIIYLYTLLKPLHKPHIIKNEDPSFHFQPLQKSIGTTSHYSGFFFLKKLRAAAHKIYSKFVGFSERFLINPAKFF